MLKPLRMPLLAPVTTSTGPGGGQERSLACSRGGQSTETICGYPGLEASCGRRPLQPHVFQWPQRAPHVLSENLLWPGCGDGLALGPQRRGQSPFSRAVARVSPHSSFWVLLTSQTVECGDPVLVSQLRMGKTKGESGKFRKHHGTHSRHGHCCQERYYFQRPLRSRMLLSQESQR